MSIISVVLPELWLKWLEYTLNPFRCYDAMCQIAEQILPMHLVQFDRLGLSF